MVSSINKIANLDTSFNEVIKLGNELLNKNYKNNSAEFGIEDLWINAEAKDLVLEFINNEDIFIEEKELLFIKDRIDNTYKGKVLISIGFLYLDCASLTFDESQSYLDNLSEKLKASKDAKVLKLYIKHLKLTLILKDEFENDEIDSASENLLKESIETNDLKLINSCFENKDSNCRKIFEKKRKGSICVSTLVN